jgi:transcriptional regulator with XRE-family HTH domain
MSNAPAEASPANGANVIVAANIRAELARRNRSQGQLAAHLGMSEMKLSRRMLSHPEFTSSEIVAVAEYFGLTPGELFIDYQDGAKRAIGGGRTLYGVGTNIHRTLTSVGMGGLEPPTSSVESRQLADVLPFRRRA